MTNTESNINPQNLTDGQKLAATTAITLPPNYSALKSREVNLLHTLKVESSPRGQFLKGQDSKGKEIIVTPTRNTKGGYFPLPLNKRNRVDLLTDKANIFVCIAFTQGNKLNSPPYRNEFDLKYSDICESLGIANVHSAQVRIKNAFMNASHLDYRFTVREKGKDILFPAARLFEVGFHTTGDAIKIVVNDIAAKALITNKKVSFYNKNTLKLTDPNAYYMALAMQQHFSQVANHRAKTANRLKVKTLLNTCYYPEIETVKKQEHSWINRIRFPFENALGLIRDTGIITKWNYKDYPEQETEKEGESEYHPLINFDSYEQWIEQTIIFELATPPDMKQAVKNVETRIKKAKEKKENKSKKSPLNR